MAGLNARTSIAAFIICCFGIAGTYGLAFFTRKPPYLQYVLQGGDATFEWDYSQDNSGPFFLGTWGVEGKGSYCIRKTATSPTPLIICSNYNLSGRATLVLKNVLHNMTDSYFCNLIFDLPNVATLQNATRLVVVRRLPTFTKPPSHDVPGIEGGKDLIITTEVAGDVAPMISWYRNGILVNTTVFPVASKQLGTNSNGDVVVQSNLTIRSPTRTSNAVFLAKAVYGQVSPASNSSVTINIWYGPENLMISSSRPGTGVSAGQSITINCSANSYPAPRFTIFLNKTVVLQNSTSGIHTIKSFSRNDTGNYSCMAKNEVNNATVDGVWFVFIEAQPTTKTTITTPTTSVTKATITATSGGISNTTTNARGITKTDDGIPWWVWLTVAIAVVVIICIVVFSLLWIRRRRSKPEKTVAMQFSKDGFDIDSYIKNTNYSLGYENHVEAKAKQENGVPVDAKPADVDTVKAALGVKFESEHDLLEHYRKGPESDGYDDVDFKSFDPFETDNDQLTDSNDPFSDDLKGPYSFDNDVYEHDDDMYKINSGSDKDSQNEAEYVQYEI